MKVTAIIPAYNEEKRIAKVLDTVTQLNIVDQIIVVSDGSTDDTAEIARYYTEDVIELKENIGKGGAIITGLSYSNADIVLLLDADLIGLTKDHVLALLEPVIWGDAETTVGIFTSGRLFTDWAQKIAPFLSGQRAIRSSLIKKIEGLDITSYGFEIALTKYLHSNKIPVKKVVLCGITHTMKEEKLGLYRGFLWRIKMYWQILKAINVDIR
ncbi:Glycosyl transferase family 2 [Geosporobacter subterraneus DSM 17957]|uniref:Glucosyl-3-phosphoglycerate synthase n=1 Tax=Geosporobacter subterraneus DSM 17957 TaxID=1121919 RepID=A0A1M6E151_9FIRM|nr:glycosyltransferase family 2 protein [Geosporobacter subterraneus]SHI79133.1 Glycosyl transferase family 2 [Geosporobacter subterraneus DSM 17957]